MRTMLPWIAALALAGCTSDSDNLPIGIGGGGGGGSTGDGTGGASTISGRVCLISDPRVLGGCATTGAGGLGVAIGGASTTTTDNGSFSMTAPSGSNLAFTVSGTTTGGTAVVPSTQPFAPTNQIPVLPADLYAQVLAANGITLTQGSGSILASVVDRGGAPVSGITATSTPSPAFGPYFDGTTPTAWTLNGTGERGVVLFPGVTTGTADLTFGSGTPTAGESTVDGVQVVDGGITFVDAVLP